MACFLHRCSTFSPHYQGEIDLNSINTRCFTRKYLQILPDDERGGIGMPTFWSLWMDWKILPQGRQFSNPLLRERILHPSLCYHSLGRPFLFPPSGFSLRNYLVSPGAKPTLSGNLSSHYLIITREVLILTPPI